MVIDEDIMETTVVDVLWNVSKDGYLKPRVQVIPVVIEGSTVTYITGNNASYIVNNNIGIGAIVKVIKSGSVIPKIQEVVVPANEPKMPTDVDYIWNETHKEIMINDKSSDSQENKKESIVKTQQKLKRIITFFKQINVEGLGEGGTYAPTRSNIQVTVQPIYSRRAVESFSLRDFVNGGYIGKGGGFI